MKGPEAVIDRVEHIREAINGLRALFQTTPRAAIEAEWMLMRGLERAIEIISEASRHIPDDLKATEPDVPWRDIAGIGNIIRHDYNGVSPVILFRVIERDLDPLDAALTRILARLPPL
jgi:uncharacterized protein with HEPN domain